MGNPDTPKMENTDVAEQTKPVDANQQAQSAPAESTGEQSGAEASGDAGTTGDGASVGAGATPDPIQTAEGGAASPTPPTRDVELPNKFLAHLREVSEELEDDHPLHAAQAQLQAAVRVLVQYEHLIVGDFKHIVKALESLL